MMLRKHVVPQSEVIRVMFWRCWRKGNASERRKALLRCWLAAPRGKAVLQRKERHYFVAQPDVGLLRREERRCFRERGKALL